MAAICPNRAAISSRSPGKLEPGERPDDVEGLAQRLATLGRSYLLLAVDDATAAGYVEVAVADFARARRTGYVVMGVRTEQARC
jgi:hypothetical protein